MRPILLAASLFLTACSSKPDHRTLRIANAGTGLQTWDMPVTLADRLGYFKEEGLDVALENLPSTTKALEAITGGSADVAICTYSQALQVATQGQRVRSFFVLTKRESKVLVVTPAARSRIRRIEDLKGALIGVPAIGSSAHQWVKYYLATHGMQPGELRAVSIGFGASAIAVIESGRIDAAAMTGGDQFQLLRRHPDVRLQIDASTPEGMRESYGSDTFAGGAATAKQEWLDRNPDAARQIARALQRTLQWIAAHKPEEIRDRLPESQRSQDAAVDLEILRWSLSSFTADGTMPAGAPEIAKRLLDAIVDQGRDSKIDLAATWTNQYLKPK
jgi:NitT/TauT family transport system substrate-binding protein